MLFEHRSARALVLLAALMIATGGPHAFAAREKAPKKKTAGGRITGSIRTADGKAVPRGATVRAYHLATGETFVSGASNRKGAYRIDGLPFGYFELAVETPGGLFVSDKVVDVPPSGKTSAGFTLRPYDAQPESWWAAHERREFSGSDTPSSGLAEVVRKARGLEFWKSKRGVIILTGVGTAALIAIVVSSDSNNPTAGTNSP